MATVVEFVGLPGVGKTTVSRAVADELRSRQVEVFQPTQLIGTRPRLRRVALKLRFAASTLLRHPRSGATRTRAVLTTDQHSLSDFVRVLFNLHYVSGVTTTYGTRKGVSLLDQGVHQGVWSVGLRSSHDWSAILSRFDEELQQVTTDLVVFVEATETAIKDRLHERTGGDTRFEPGMTAFDHGVEGYERLKEQVQTADNGCSSIVVGNETRNDIQPNAVRIAEKICSLDE